MNIFSRRETLNVGEGNLAMYFKSKCREPASVVYIAVDDPRATSAMHAALLPYNLYAGQYTVMKFSKARGKKMLGFIVNYLKS